MNNLFKRIKNKVWKRIYGVPPLPQLIRYVPNGNAKVLHISAQANGNAGDTFLPVVLRDLFNLALGVRTWKGRDVHKLVDSKDLRLYNECSYIVIGGGGLFLSDTCPNDISGWQWNCDIDHLMSINKPIVMFAVGYNRFRGQEDFKPIFTEHLNRFVEKAVFVGIRNRGSIAKLKSYLYSEELKSKLVFQPCMTTLTSKIYPNLQDYSQKQDFVAINCAFDRKKLRSSNSNYLDSIARVALNLSKITKVKLYTHMPSDKEIIPYLEKFHVPYELVELVYISDILKKYTSPRLVLGMRGHAQMIPFGCNTPIVSIISHDKMQWFLDDIHHPDWGVDVNDPYFEEKLLSKALDAYKNYDSRISDICKAQDELWSISLNNLKTINHLVNNN